MVGVWRLLDVFFSIIKLFLIFDMLGLFVDGFFYFFISVVEFIYMRFVGRIFNVFIFWIYRE